MGSDDYFEDWVSPAVLIAGALLLFMYIWANSQPDSQHASEEPQPVTQQVTQEKERQVMSKTVYAVALITNPAWGLRSPRNALTEFSDLRMFTSEKQLVKYLEDQGFEPKAKTQYQDARAVEVRRRTVR